MKNLGKVIASQIAKELEDIKVGEDQVLEYNVSGRAIIRKGEDYDQVVVASIPFDKLFAHAMSHLNGVTVESIVREVLSGRVDSSEVKAQVAEAVKTIKGTSTKTCAGKVTVKDPTVALNTLKLL